MTNATEKETISPVTLRAQGVYDHLLGQGKLTNPETTALDYLRGQHNNYEEISRALWLAGEDGRYLTVPQVLDKIAASALEDGGLTDRVRDTATAEYLFANVSEKLDVGNPAAQQEMLRFYAELLRYHSRRGGTLSATPEELRETIIPRYCQENRLGPGLKTLMLQKVQPRRGQSVPDKIW